MDNSNSTVARTPNPECYYCLNHRRHRVDDFDQKEQHPYRGHGYNKEQGWTHPDLEPRK